MKFILCLNLIIGIGLFIIEFIFKFDDILGYTLTVLGLIFALSGMLLNKKLREFVFNAIINFI